MNDIDDSPTIISLQDTISLLEKRLGKDWMKYPEAKMTVIWASRLFLEDHVKDICPDLYDLCMEYRNSGTVNGKKMPDNFDLMAFGIF